MGLPGTAEGPSAPDGSAAAGAVRPQGAGRVVRYGIK